MNAASTAGVAKSSGPSASAWPSAAPNATNGSEPPLLPDPTGSTSAGGDALALLYLFEAKDQDLTVSQGTTRVATLQTERDQALVQEQQAIQNEDTAAKQQSVWGSLGSILGDVAKVAGVVASIAAAVCTMGAATPLVVLAVAGAVLSAASMADGEFHVLQKLGIDSTTAGWIDLGMGVAGGICSAGASLAAGARAASDAANAVGAAASVASGAATMGEGATTVEEGEAQSASDRAAADEASAQSTSAGSLRWIQMILDEVQSSDQESQQMLATIATTKGTLNDTATAAATALRG